jgi:hypothetical protein
MDGLQQNPDITALRKDISDLNLEVNTLKVRMEAQKENADMQIRSQKENADMQIRYLQWALGLLFTVFGIIAVILARVAEVI